MLNVDLMHAEMWTLLVSQWWLTVKLMGDEHLLLPVAKSKELTTVEP